jgi:hypothetical protein
VSIPPFARSKADGAAFVNALRFRGVDAGALPIVDEAKLHLGDRAEHSQDHAAHRAAGIDGRLQHPKAGTSLFEFVHEVEDVPSVSAQAVQLDHDEGIAGANEVEIDETSWLIGRGVRCV